MANKKNRRSRPTSAAQTGGATTATEAQTVKPAPAAPGGPNRQARKDEARRQREAIRKRMARRRILQRVAIVLAVVLVAGAIGAYFVLRTTPADAAGCGSVETVPAFDPASQDQAHIGAGEVATPPPLSDYPSTPPVSGPHDPSPQPAGIYDTPPDVFRTIHSLEHGAVIIWYNPSATGPELDEIKAFYQDPVEQRFVLVAPYSYPDEGAAGALPAGKDMALVAWHRLQSCDDLSLDAVKSFVGQFRFNPDRPGNYRGEAPEAGAAI